LNWSRVKAHGRRGGGVDGAGKSRLNYLRTGGIRSLTHPLEGACRGETRGEARKLHLCCRTKVVRKVKGVRTMRQDHKTVTKTHQGANASTGHGKKNGFWVWKKWAGEGKGGVVKRGQNYQNQNLERKPSYRTTAGVTVEKKKK